MIVVDSDNAADQHHMLDISHVSSVTFPVYYDTSVKDDLVSLVNHRQRSRAALL